METAIELAIDDSIEAGILSDLLQKNRAEVKDLLLTEYDEEKHLKNVKDMGWTSVDREYQKQLLNEYNIW